MSNLKPTSFRRFVLERDDDGWTIGDYYRGGSISFETREEGRRHMRFVRKYVARWGDIDLESFPYSLDEPPTIGENADDD